MSKHSTKGKGTALLSLILLLTFLGSSGFPVGILEDSSVTQAMVVPQPFPQQVPRNSPPLPGDEIIGERTRTSKTYYLGEDSYSWDGTISSIHYESNGWQEIDNILEPAVAPWDWQMLQAGYHIRVREDFTTGQILEFEKQGEAVQFQPMALEWTNDLDQIQQISMPQSTTPIVTNPEVDLLSTVGVLSHQGTIRWDNAYGQGIDFEWKCTPTRLVKVLEVESSSRLSSPEQYILDGGNPVLRLNLIFAPSSNIDIYVNDELWDRSSRKQTFSIIEFRKDGEVLWGFMPLRYWDSEGNDGQSVATLEKSGNKLYISVRVPYDWLQTAVYPVFVDTDVDEQVGAGLDDAHQSGGTMYTTSLFFYIAAAGPGGTIGGARFQTVALPNGATIDAAYVTLHAEYNQSNPKNGRIRAEDIDNAPAFTTNDNNITNRSFTSGSTTSWTAQTACTDYNSDSIVNEIQAVVNRAGWVSNNALVLAFDSVDAGNGGYASTFESVNTPVRLHIEYTPAVEFESTGYPLYIN